MILEVIMNTSDLVRRVDALIERGNMVLATRTGEGLDETVDTDAIRKFCDEIALLIEIIHGYSRPLNKQFATEAEKYNPGDVEEGIAVLKSLRTEILYAGEFGS
jgi:hypothetical protein